MTAEFSVVWFWVPKDIAPSPPLTVTYIPHLFYLSPEHHAGILRKHLHFHPATASRTAQTTCRRDGKDSKLQQETAPQPDSRQCCCFSKPCESSPLLDIWMLLSVCAAKVPQNTPTCTQATGEQGMYHHLGSTSRTQPSPDSAHCWSWPGFVFLPSFLFLGTFPWASWFSPLSITFNFASSQSTLSFLPLSPMCWTGQRRPPNTLSLHVKRDSTLSCCPFGCTIFHMRDAKEYKGRKRSSCFAGAFSHFICRYRHISGVLGGRIKASFLHFNPALPFPKPSLEHSPISTGCWSRCEDAWVRLTSGDSTACLLGLAGNWPAL